MINSLFLPSPVLQRSKRPQLRWALHGPHRSLSWAIHGGGFLNLQELIWLQVKNSDLSLGVCPKGFILKELETTDASSPGLVFLTSAFLDFYQEVRMEENGIEALAIATTGLGNALRAGDPIGMSNASRTINLACLVNIRLSDNAMLEALSIMTEAKTAAILEAGVLSRETGLPATGTGTDCQAIVCPERGVAEDYSGKHTLVGSLIGRACMEAIRLGILAWNETTAERERGKSKIPTIENLYHSLKASERSGGSRGEATQ